MALVIERLPREVSRPQVVANQRLWKTKDGKRLVPDGHPDAAFLFCIPGRKVDAAEFEALTVEERPADKGAEPPREAGGDPAPEPEASTDAEAAEPEHIPEPEADASEPEAEAEGEGPPAPPDDPPPDRSKKVKHKKGDKARSEGEDK